MFNDKEKIKYQLTKSTKRVTVAEVDSDSSQVLDSNEVKVSEPSVPPENEEKKNEVNDNEYLINQNVLIY